MSYPSYGSVGAPDTIVGGRPQPIVGGHYAQIIGSLQPVIGAAISQGIAQAMAEARKIDPNAVMVAPRERDQRRRQVIGHEPVTVAGGATAQVELKPQQLFRVERIFIPSEIASSFRLRDIRVGNQSQLLQAGSLPAQAFTEVSIDSYVDFDTADIGNTITLEFTNKTNEEKVFSSMLAGTVVK